MAQHTTRITAGAFRYKLLKQPGEGTRPVSQKVRQAIFNVLGDELEGLTVLDLYAGSGALGFEALSRGAERVTFVEQSSFAVSFLRANVKELQADAQTAVMQAEVAAWLATSQAKFDLVFLDPPYAEFSSDLVESALAHVSEAGTLVVSCGAREKLPAAVAEHQLVKVKIYGGTQIGYYK